MKKHNALDERKKELCATGLCSSFDFVPECKTRIENYTFDFSMSDEALAVFKLAHEYFGFTDSHLERLERITKAILALDGKNTVEAYHIAEAIQYINIR